MKLNNKVAVITGGAGQIGRAVAHRLAQHEARVFLLVRRDLATAQTLCENLPNSHLQHQAILADVKDPNQVRDAAQQVKILAGSCDILINSAAVALHATDALHVSDEYFDETMAVNLKGPWLMIREFHDMLKQSGDALIVNISSMASVKPRPTSIFYSMSKAGLNAMTQSLALMLGPEVRVVAIAPSMLEAPVSGYPLISEKHHNVMPVDMAKNMSAVKRICTADDVADVIESLATTIKFYNGHLIMLDGGT